MKPIVIFDRGENDLASRKYFAGVCQYAQSKGLYIAPIADLDQVGNCTVICNAEQLKPSRIMGLKDRGNLIVSLDVNDSSFPNLSYERSKEMYFIDLIFKVSGIQQANSSKELSVDHDFNFSIVDEEFLPQEWWDIYRQMDQEGRMIPLPHVPWEAPHITSKPHDQRSGKILFRGGCQIYRFLTFLMAVKKGISDPNSSFATSVYFDDGMNPQYRFCDECRHGDRGWKSDPHEQCSSPAKWGETFDLSTRFEANRWDNKCPRSFMWLVEQFEKRHGELDHDAILRTIHGRFDSTESFMNVLGSSTFYADFKPIFSIYCPPRFWEAANAGTVNLLPSRTKDQKHFPDVKESSHYAAFREDFAGLDHEIDSHIFDAITGNAKDLYETWIRHDRFPISENLAGYILSRIESLSERG